MLGVLGEWKTRRRERRAAADREEAEFLAACEALVWERVGGLVEAGLATVEADPGEKRGAPPSLLISPTRAESPGLWVGFDYPSFCLTLPRPGGGEPLEATAELFGTYEERLEEVALRLDAVFEGRLAWRYVPKGGCVHIDWLRADGDPFLSTAYSGLSQGDEESSGRSAPYAA